MINLVKQVLIGRSARRIDTQLFIELFNKRDIHLPPEIMKDNQLLLNAIVNNRFVFDYSDWDALRNLKKRKKITLLLVSPDISSISEIFTEEFWISLNQGDWSLLKHCSDLNKLPSNYVIQAQLKCFI